VLHEHRPNQQTTYRWCAACISDDSAARSAAATGRAGRPPKTASTIQDQIYKFVLSRNDAKTLDLWLAEEGYGTERQRGIKAWALAMIAARRARPR